MPVDHMLIYGLLLAVVVLLVTEWIPLEATAWLPLGFLAVTGLVPAEEALAGFSSPAVITIWAVFILSGALDRTGVADRIGRGLQRMAGQTELGLTTVLMRGAGLMSAVMNKVAVAAMPLPVAMNLVRANHIPPSRLLLPLAYGSLLGALTTTIGTPPNILVTSALKEAGLNPFGRFDFTPVGGIILLAGTAFMVIFGRCLLPRRDVAAAAANPSEDLPGQHHLQVRTFALQLPLGNPLVGRTLADSRLGTATGLYVVAVIRGGQIMLTPSPNFALASGDRLFVQGRLEWFYDIQSLVNLILAEKSINREWFAAKGLVLAEIWLPEGSKLVGCPLTSLPLELEGTPRVLALRRGETLLFAPEADATLQTGDRVLLYGDAAIHKTLQAGSGSYQLSESQEALHLQGRYQLKERLVSLHLVEDADLLDISLELPRLEELLGIKILSLQRTKRCGHGGGRRHPEHRGSGLRPGCSRVAPGVVRPGRTAGGHPGLPQRTARLRPNRLGRSGAPPPRSALFGKILRQLRFCEKYGLGILAIWRAGRAYRTTLRDFELPLGDALLPFWPLDRIRALAGNPDLIVLSGSLQEPRRSEKAVTASLVMVVTRCLTMVEAYRAIEWKAVFLIAGLLPLGTAVERSGIATEVASGVAQLAGSYGPLALLARLVALTFAATCIIPTAAMVLLMAPIALNTAAVTGLSPHALLMASSASFLTPIAHPANILVMGPGGYRFRDYILVGLPLTLVVFFIILVAVPLFWPLQP